MDGKPNRCKKCRKIIREHNKSGYCHYHSVLYKKTHKFKCCICKESCNGDMRDEGIRKGATYYFCTFHFNYYMMKTPKQMRKIIRNVLTIK